MTSMARIIIQPDWDSILKEDSDEHFWVQYKFASGESSINDKLSFVEHNEHTNFISERSARNKFSIRRISKSNKSVEIRYQNESVQLVRKFVAPIQTFALHFDESKAATDSNSNRKPQPVISLDVTNGGIGVSGSKNGSLLIWLTENGRVRRILNGHVEDVYVCRFFPSGVVVLSGAADFKLKIWSAEDGSCPVSIISHAYGVSDVAIVDRGKNVVSVGRDGECKLHDVGQAKCLATVAKFGSIVNACSIQAISSVTMQALKVPEREDSTINEREVGTEDKIVACACEDGFLRLIALRCRKQIFELNCGSSVNCCCFISDSQVACGTQNGLIFVHDLLNNTTIVYREFRSHILSISAFGQNGALIATSGDGSCFTFNPSNSTASVVDLTGPNCDPVYKVAFNETHVFTCCRDGLIRKYDLKSIINDD